MLIVAFCFYRSILDDAEDFIVNDPDKAIEKINKILVDHPKSARARCVNSTINVRAPLADLMLSSFA